MAVSFTRLQSEAIDNYGSKEAFDNLARFDGVVWWLGQKGNIVFETGGQPTFRERILYGHNTNIGFRGKNAPIPQNDDEGYTLATAPQQLISGAIKYNQQELDQVRGNWAIAESIIKDKTDQFGTTWVQTVAGQIRQASPVPATDMLTLLPSSSSADYANGILAPVAPASQTATTCSIPRSETTTSPEGQTIRYWANQYSNTSYDLTAAAGRRGLWLDVYSKCVRGNGKQFEPDFGLCGDVAVASLSATADGNRRYTFDEKVLEYGFENIKFNNAVIFIDRSTRFINGSAAKVAFLNSRALKLKVLQGSGGVTKDMLDERNNLKSVPIFWKHKGMSDYASLNYNWVGYCTMNLVPRSLQDLGLADNCS